MRNIKKLLSIVMVLTLVLSLGVSAFAAAADKADITITDKNGTGSTYDAYRLLLLTTNSEADTGKEGSKGFAYTVNPKYLSILEAVSKVKDAPDPQYGSTIVKYISELDAGKLRTFADDVFAAIEAAVPKIDPDATATGTVFTDVDQGYYLIVENVSAAEDSQAVRSLVMLDTAGQQNVTVSTKEDKPSSEKKVKEKNDTTGVVTGWQDGADWDIGDAVPFQLKATIPAGTTTPYGTYELIFHDQESEGLTFDPLSVKVYLNGGTDAVDTSKYHVQFNVGDGCTFHVVFEDIKTISGFDATQENVITVEYTATLNENAAIGSTGNPNEMHIEHSNNPYGEGTSRTPDDKVIVFTFTIEADKVGGDEHPLDGAGFTLLKEIDATLVPAGTTATSITDYKELGKLDAGVYVTYNSKTYVVAEKQMTGVTEFQFKGQDSGNYLLVETQVPDGYNKADDIEFTVAATYDTESADPKLNSLTVTPDNGKFTCNPVDGTVKTTVVNQTGLELPSTGGIGTTIFYVVGAILVAGAVILLVTKKRASDANK